MLIIWQIAWREVGVAFELQCLRNCTLSSFFFFLPRVDVGARRRSGAPSKVYQWLGPRCRQKVTRKNLANRPPLIFTGGQKVRNLASILKISRV